MQNKLILGSARTDQGGQCDFRWITYEIAINQLRAMGESIKWGGEISADQENLLVKRHGNVPLFITHWPESNAEYWAQENEKRPRVSQDVSFLELD